MTHGTPAPGAAPGAPGTVTILKPYSLEALHRGAKKRPPGYLKAVLAAAKKQDDTLVWLDARDAARITQEYGAAVPITRPPTDHEKNLGGCSGCGSGTSSTTVKSTPAPDPVWLEAVNQGNQQE